MQWEQFLADNGIEYVTRGPNTKHGEVSVKCPFCGEDDPSQHLGINLSREAWGCHRDAQHRGKSPVWLVQALLGCSNAQARLVVAQYEHSDPDGLDAALVMLGATSEAPRPEKRDDMPEPVEFPREFRNIARGDRFDRYLQSRGYTPIETGFLCDQYNLKCATTGPYKDRVIFPVYLNGLIGWTGRAISDPVSAPRYKASSPAVKASLYNYDRAAEVTEGDCLFVCEGPMDVLRLDFAEFKHLRSNRYTIHRAVALMGTNASVSQLCLLRALSKKYRNVKIFLDEDALGPASSLRGWLGPNAEVAYLTSAKDPGALAPDRVQDVLRSCTS